MSEKREKTGSVEPDGSMAAPQRLDIETIEWNGRLWKLCPDPDTLTLNPTSWNCTIGECPRNALPKASDAPMRAAVARAYEDLAGHPPEFIFSGWNAHVPESYRAVIEDRLPRTEADG